MKITLPCGHTADVLDVLAAIPDAALKSERGRRNAAKRVGPTGGKRPGAGRPKCECGECAACQRRARAAMR